MGRFIEVVHRNQFARDLFGLKERTPVELVLATLSKAFLKQSTEFQVITVLHLNLLTCNLQNIQSVKNSLDSLMLAVS